LKIFIAGSSGIPAKYGGFETFAENVSIRMSKIFEVYVACSKFLYTKIERNTELNYVKRLYIPLKANGIQSLFYDFVSLLIANVKTDFIIMLGAGSGFSVAFFKIIFKKTIIVHIDGLEWKRNKWNYFVKLFLKQNTWLCYRFSDFIIIDNKALLDYVPLKFHYKLVEIGYGCDHLPEITKIEPPYPYALAIARAEPENNLQAIIETFLSDNKINLVIISNWNDTAYGRSLKKLYSDQKNIKLIDAIYNDPKLLHQYRLSCKVYIHGHSAGGTNPSLVEAMAAGIPIIAYDNKFNRITTNNISIYFNNIFELQTHLNNLDSICNSKMGPSLKDYALKNYQWENVTSNLVKIINNKNIDNR